MNIFAKGLKQKVRFSTKSGNLSIEQVMDLPLESTKGAACLRTIAESLQKEMGDAKSALPLAFFSAPSVDPLVQLKFDIIEAIVIDRVKDNMAKTAKKVKDTKKAELDELIAQKKQEATKALSLEELIALRDSL